MSVIAREFDCELTLTLHKSRRKEVHLFSITSIINDRLYSAEFPSWNLIKVLSLDVSQREREKSTYFFMILTGSWNIEYL